MDGTPFRGISDPTVEGVQISGITFIAARMYSTWVTKPGDVTFTDCEWRVRKQRRIWFPAKTIGEFSHSPHRLFLLWLLEFSRTTLHQWCQSCWTFSMGPIRNFQLFLTVLISMYVKRFDNNFGFLKCLDSGSHFPNKNRAIVFLDGGLIRRSSMPMDNKMR